MPLATDKSGDLIPIDDIYIEIVGQRKITFNNLPDISDSKSASYADESSIGRSTPFKNYSNSDNRVISWGCHFYVKKKNDDLIIMRDIRLLQSCTYPQTQTTGGAPYAPPPICHLKCGKLLGDNFVCAVLKSYSIKYDTTLPWNKESLLPYKTDMELTFEVVYNQSDLPGSERIMNFGA